MGQVEKCDGLFAKGVSGVEAEVDSDGDSIVEDEHQEDVPKEAAPPKLPVDHTRQRKQKWRPMRSRTCPTAAGAPTVSPEREFHLRTGMTQSASALVSLLVLTTASWEMRG